MLLTEVRQQKNHSQRFSLYIDGEFAVGLPAVDFVNLKLSVGMVLTDELLFEIKRISLLSALRERGFGYVSRRLHSESEIRRKLFNSVIREDLKFPSNVIETCIDEVLKTLTEYGYIDDLRFATEFFNERLSRYGEAKVRYELKGKGVSNATIDEALNSLERSDDDEIQLIIDWIHRKTRSLPIEPHNLQKLISSLSRRGFPYAKIKKAIEVYNSLF